MPLFQLITDGPFRDLVGVAFASFSDLEMIGGVDNGAATVAIGLHIGGDVIGDLLRRRLTGPNALLSAATEDEVFSVGLSQAVVNPGTDRHESDDKALHGLPRPVIRHADYLLRGALSSREGRGLAAGDHVALIANGLSDFPQRG